MEETSPLQDHTTQLQVEIVDLEDHEHGVVLRVSCEVDFASRVDTMEQARKALGSD